ncbi:MAG: hypothetical protein U0441_31620 [Polyangiaceae bacterium]
MKKIPWSTAWLGLVAIGTVGFLPACGGSDTSASGGGGSGTTTTTTPSGGTGGAGGETTTTTPGLADGSPCTSNEECAGTFCISQGEYGWPYGYCTGACNSLIVCEDPASTCVTFSAGGFCLKSCSAPADCGPGQTCFDPMDGSQPFCYAFCTKDSECEGYGKCDTTTGACYVPEDCATPGDEDGDGLADCEDSDCATSCTAMIEAACGAAVALDVQANATASKQGDTTNGTSLFAGVCSGSAEKENVFKVTNKAGKDGLLELTLVSAEDLSIYARNDCAGSGDLACENRLTGGADPEAMYISVTNNQTFYVYVDGSSSDDAPNAGAYTLSATLLSVQPETEPNNDGPSPGPSTANTVNISSLPAIPVGAADQATDNDDWYVIDTTALVGNKTISVSVIGYGADSCAPTGEIDTAIELVGADGTTIESNDDVSNANWCSAVTHADLPPAKYYVHAAVSDLCNTSFGFACKFQYGLKINVQ